MAEKWKITMNKVMAISNNIVYKTIQNENNFLNICENVRLKWILKTALKITYPQGDRIILFIK